MSLETAIIVSSFYSSLPVPLEIKINQNMPYSAPDEIFISVTIDGFPRSWHELNRLLNWTEVRAQCIIPKIYFKLFSSVSKPTMILNYQNFLSSAKKL